MFTGIIQYTAKVLEINKKEESLFVTFEKPKDLNLSIGCSVAVNGVCSTSREFDDERWVVEYMPETLRLTTIGDLNVGDIVNIEPTLKLGDELSGHMVQGHADDVGEVVKIIEEGLSWVMTIKAPREIMDYIVHKGSIAVEGISLTVSALDENEKTFDISLIEHTLDHTNLRQKKVGTKVNLEVDIIGKYLKKYIPKTQSTTL